MLASGLAEPPARGTGVQVVPPARRVAGTVRLPGDKSISHRAALLNAVAEGQTTITNFAPGADCASTLACLRQLGASVARDGDTVRVEGRGPRGLREPADVLDCGNAGTTMRLLCGVLAGQELFAVLTGDGSLRARPMARVVEPLRQMGARIAGRDGGRLPPLAVAPADGPLRGADHQLAVASAQVKSAVLLAGLAAAGSTTVREPSPSRDHTERMLRAMGADVRTSDGAISVVGGGSLAATDVVVPGDFSSAAPWLVLACLHRDAEVRVEGVGLNPTRTGLLTVLRHMGANVEVVQTGEVAGEPAGDIVAWSSQPRGAKVGGDLVPFAIDEMPLVALLGAFADGETVVRDAAELRVKESDRLQAVAEGLGALGVDIQVVGDGWRVRPSRLRWGRAHSRGDHRVAMLLAIAGALGEGVEIEGAEAVSVSYPGFWDQLGRLTEA